MKDLYVRTKNIAMYIVDNKSTIRKTAIVFGLSKSTVHYDISHRLPKIDTNLYNKVRQILDENFEQKNIKGGIATKNKYKRL